MRRPSQVTSAFALLIFLTLLGAPSPATASSVAVDDVISGDPGSTIAGSVLDNDTVPALATAEAVAAPVYGTLVGDGAIYGGVTPWGEFEYQPAPGFSGVDAFAYRLRTDDGVSVTATVYLLVGPVQILSRPGSEPRLTELAISLPSFVNRTSAELAEADDLASQRFSVLPARRGSGLNLVADSPAGEPALETWAPSAAGTDASAYALNSRPWQRFTFEPVGGGAFRVISEFTGFALTADGTSAGANVSAGPVDGSDAQQWLLAGPDQAPPPIAENDFFAADPADLDGIVAGNVLSNDVATSFDLLSLLASPPENGELVGLGQIFDGLTPFGTFEYRPNPGFRGIDRFTYYVLSSSGGTPSRLATVEIQVGDNAPIARDDVVATAPDTLVMGDV
ncbi:MAG: Ig-like domain-containing protein, partial [Acidobacteriota bacterium]